jgi:hypothetical protein
MTAQMTTTKPMDGTIYFSTGTPKTIRLVSGCVSQLTTQQKIRSFR